METDDFGAEIFTLATKGTPMVGVRSTHHEVSGLRSFFCPADMHSDPTCVCVCIYIYIYKEIPVWVVDFLVGGIRSPY